MTDDSLSFIKTLSWNEVFAAWRNGEAKLPRWIEHYQEKGFGTWDEWRAHTLQELHPEHLVWKLYSVADPVRTVPNFLGGPFRAWMKKYYDGAEYVPFSRIIHHRDLEQSVIVQEMLANFPEETVLIGLKTPHGIVVIEGMHRACTLALAALQKKPLRTKVFIALAEFTDPVPHIGQADSPT